MTRIGWLRRPARALLGPQRYETLVRRARALAGAPDKRPDIDPQVEIASVCYRPRADCQVRGLDGLYQAAFGVRSDGVFVEVGAHDGQSFSNTCFLADLGWRGVYVEPVPRFAEACAARHRSNPGIAVVNAAVGASGTSIKLHVADTHSTAAEDHFAAYQTITWAKNTLTDQTIEVPVVRLDALLEAHAIAPGFELLVVDVEGYEPEVFASFDLHAWRPRMLIVELPDLHRDFAQKTQIVEGARALRASIVACGYLEVYVDQINTVFLRAERPASP